jgi:hypothetical protein
MLHGWLENVVVGGDRGSEVMEFREVHNTNNFSKCAKGAIFTLLRPKFPKPRTCNTAARAVYIVR